MSDRVAQSLSLGTELIMHSVCVRRDRQTEKDAVDVTLWSVRKSFAPARAVRCDFHNSLHGRRQKRQNPLYAAANFALWHFWGEIRLICFPISYFEDADFRNSVKKRRFYHVFDQIYFETTDLTKKWMNCNQVCRNPNFWLFSTTKTCFSASI